MPSLKRVHAEEQYDGSPPNILGGHESARPRQSKPLQYSGSLEVYQHQDVTPIIGTEFEGLQVTDLLNGSDETIRDLAVTGMTRVTP